MTTVILVASTVFLMLSYNCVQCQDSEGDLRLVGGSNRCEGRLQVLVFDLSSSLLRWSTTCDRDFSTEEMRTACRQLGCPTGNPSRQSISRFGGRPPSPHVYQAFGFTCSGRENKVVSCPYTGAFCDISRIDDIIGISCNDGDESTTTAAPTQPPGGPAEGELRLAGGPNSCEGRLEVYVPFLGEWAQAIYRDFGIEEVQVACRELGCGDGARIRASSDTGPYLEVGYQCSGEERTLQECQPISAFSRSRDHYIGLRCSAASSPSPSHSPIPSSTPNPSASPSPSSTPTVLIEQQLTPPPDATDTDATDTDATDTDATDTDATDTDATDTDATDTDATDTPPTSNTLIIIVSVGVGGVVVVCALVAVTVVAAVARAKMRKDRKSADVPHVFILQQPPMVSPRGKISSPIVSYNYHGGTLSTPQNSIGEGPAHGRDPRVPSTYFRQMSGRMLIPSHCIRLMECIGQGEFGVVYRAHLSGWEDEPSQIVAVKTLKGMSSMGDITELLEESLKMKSFAHPNILNLIGVCVDAGPAPYVIMPYMANGSLLHYLRQERPHLTIAEGAEPEQVSTVQRKLLPMCLQIAKGMEYLAKEKFLHRDLAARNCMINSDGVIKVADFGLSENIYSRNYFRQGHHDAPVRLPIRWMALESLQDGIFSEKTDVWSFGVTCWEIYSLGRTPYQGLDPFSLISLLETGQRLKKPTNAACTDEIYSTVLHCWCENVDRRPPFSELVMDIETTLEDIAGYIDFSYVSIMNTESGGAAPIQSRR